MKFDLPTSAHFLHNSLHDPLSAYDAHKPQAIYLFSVIVLVIILTGIYHDRGILVCGAIISYNMALSTMSVLIRNLFVNHHFNYPTWITATHAVATFIVGMSVLLYRKKTYGTKIKVPDRSMITFGLIPVGISFALSIGLSNIGLMYTNAHFYEMFGSPIALITFSLGLALGQPMRWPLVAPMFILTCGLVILSFGELTFDAFGAICISFSVLARAAKAQLQSRLLNGEDRSALDPVELAVWVSVVCFVILVSWSAATEGLAPYKEIWSIGTFASCLATMVNASILNIVALFVLRDLGPVAQQVVGQFKGVLSCLAAVAAFGEEITAQQITGYSVLIIGSAWYNTRDRHLKDEEKALQQKLAGFQPAPTLYSAVTKV